MSPAGRHDDPPEPTRPHTRGSFIVELKKRQVLPAAGAYAAVAWGITEILDGLVIQFAWPDWIATLAVIVFVTGFPVAMFLAWVLDWRDGGIHRDEPWTNSGWLSLAVALIFLVAGSGALFWLINPSGVAHRETIGVAALPCRYSGEPQWAFRAEGLAGMSNDLLSHVDALRVPDFASVVHFAAGSPHTSDWGASGRLAWLVECRLVGEAGHWRLAASLVEVNGDRSEPLLELEGPAAELAGMPASVVRAVISRIAPGARAGQIPADRFPSRLSNLDDFLKGEQAMRSGEAAALREARDRFRAAYQGIGSPLARLREVDAWLNHLLIDPPAEARAITAALSAMGLVLAEVERVDPPLADTPLTRMRLALASERLGQAGPTDVQQMREWAERSLAVRPSNPEAYRLLGAAAERRGESKAAAEWRQQAEAFLLRLPEPGPES